LDSTIFHDYNISGDCTASLEGWSITNQYRKQTKIITFPGSLNYFSYDIYSGKLFHILLSTNPLSATVTEKTGLPSAPSYAVYDPTNAILLLVGNDPAPALYRSDDYGDSWTKTLDVPGNTFVVVPFLGGKFIMDTFVTDHQELFFSGDGSNWSNAGITFTVSSYSSSIVYVGGYYHLYYYSDHGYHRSSPDLTTWSSPVQISDDLFYINCVSSGDDSIFGIGAGSPGLNLYRSTDGTSFSVIKEADVSTDQVIETNAVKCLNNSHSGSNYYTYLYNDITHDFDNLGAKIGDIQDIDIAIQVGSEYVCICNQYRYLYKTSDFLNFDILYDFGDGQTMTNLYGAPVS